MANQLYLQQRQAYLTGNSDWTVQDMGMILLSDLYVFNEADLIVADIEPASRAANGQITNQIATNGFAQGQGVLFAGLTHPDILTQVVLFDLDGGNFENSALVAYYDTIDGFPLQANGGNYQILPDLSFGGYFRL